MKVGLTIQQPNEMLDYDFDYSDWFGNLDDALAGFSVTSVPAGLTVTASVAADKMGKIWVSGGLADVTYYVEVTATTVAGRIKQDELEVLILEIV